MKRINAAKIIDSILIFLVSAIFFMSVAGFFLRGVLNVIFAGLAGGVSLTALIGMLQKKRSGIPENEIKEVMSQFIFNEERYAYGFIKTALGKKYKVLAKRTWLKVNSTAVFVRLKPEKISANDLSEMFAKSRGSVKKLVILSLDGLSSTAAALKESFPDIQIHVFGAEKVYKLLLWLGALPPVTVPLKKHRPNLKRFFVAALSPANTRGYLFTAFVLVCSSLVMAYKIYYIAAASVCLALGLAAKLNLSERFKNSRTAAH